MKNPHYEVTAVVGITPWIVDRHPAKTELENVKSYLKDTLRGDGITLKSIKIKKKALMNG